MSKGGGGSAPPQAPTSSTVTQTNLPAYAEPFFTRLLERTEEESAADYIPFEGQRIADFGTDTTAGFQGIRDIAGSGRSGLFGTAQGGYESTISNDPAQQAQFANLGSYTDSGVASQYMNPFIQNVLDVQKQRATQRFGEQGLARDASAVQAGAFGGDRRFIEDAIAQREANLQLNEIEARGLAQAYESGADIFQGEQSRDLQNRGINAQVFDRNRQALLEQGRNQLGASQGLMAQAGQEEALALNRARSLAGVGGTLDQQTQQGLDLAFADFQNQRDYPRNQLNFYSGILRGVPISANQEVTNYQAPPNQLSQLLGAGLGAASIYSGLQS